DLEVRVAEPVSAARQERDRAVVQQGAGGALDGERDLHGAAPVGPLAQGEALLDGVAPTDVPFGDAVPDVLEPVAADDGVAQAGRRPVALAPPALEAQVDAPAAVVAAGSRHDPPVVEEPGAHARREQLPRLVDAVDGQA